MIPGGSQGSATSDVVRLSKLEELLAGGFAGGISRICIAPLDVAKIRFQLQVDPVSPFGDSARPKWWGQVQPASLSIRRPKYSGVLQTLITIAREEGPSALWKGNAAAEGLWIGYTATQFLVYGELVDLLHRTLFRRNEWARNNFEGGFVENLVTGGLAGGVATVTTYPLDVIRTRLAAQGEPKVYQSSMCVVRSILRNEGGVPGLYRGLGPVLVSIAPGLALTFGFYGWFKSIGWGDSAVHPVANLGVGAMAGGLAKLAVYPLDLVKRRMQMQYSRATPQVGEWMGGTKTVLESLHRIVGRDGVRGLYRGVIPALAKAVPATALTFTVYEQTKLYFLRKKAMPQSDMDPISIPAV
mmetsp:Transcript_13661/g.23413  ORF Transcript_13661/g.23413 Transcript_13661/m.23413 type:complete len:356 (-) Transcript_13661:25-1092(-)|eukprot:CAMPEP_0196657256 /NCGR_PEP_ID=MMETSP1086-20130531/22538_1 /TAXON_ID=77921 /ORGANISM="Cyanoptyche  gloeocystis , Strain SAG4.97" /LENGTH=355 /DNA_ID=CAMNT_0041990315 /DNA_START=91 /DNA_END=1158 /DNA_ORIENTATION=-